VWQLRGPQVFVTDTAWSGPQGVATQRTTVLNSHRPASYLSHVVPVGPHFIPAWILKSVEWPITDLTIWVRFSAGPGIFNPTRADHLWDQGDQVSTGALCPAVNDSRRQDDPIRLYRLRNMWSSTSNEPYCCLGVGLVYVGCERCTGYGEVTMFVLKLQLRVTE
jgi:hypothetical protein